jgi:cytochrome b561
MAPRKTKSDSQLNTYSSSARRFHWTTVALVLALALTGVIMTERGEANIWDATTNGLYSSHKLMGFVTFWFVLWRLSYRARMGAPRPEPTLEPMQRIASSAVHWAMYGLLFLVPLLGWLGVSMYPALDIFGVFSLPALTGKSAAAAQVFTIHKTLAWGLLALVVLHVAAALYHYFVRKDGVLARMLPWAGRRT